MKDKSKTASQLLEELQNDPKHQKMLKEKEEMRERIEQNAIAGQRELLQELNGVGINITSVWDLVNTKLSYPNAISILIKYLPKMQDDNNKEGIIRALAVREAIGLANDVLLSEFENMSIKKVNLKWIIGNTIFKIITSNDLNRVLKIVSEKDNGFSRQIFVLALGKLKSRKTEDVLIELLNDEEVVLQAISSLGKLKSQLAKNRLIILASDSNQSVRDAAKKALKKITG